MNPTQAWMPGIHQEREKENKDVHTSLTLLGACRRRSTRPLLASAGFAPYASQLLQLWAGLILARLTRRRLFSFNASSGSLAQPVHRPLLPTCVVCLPSACAPLGPGSLAQPARPGLFSPRVPPAFCRLVRRRTPLLGSDASAC
jgi:hypothetical protein